MGTVRAPPILAVNSIAAGRGCYGEIRERPHKVATQKSVSSHGGHVVSRSRQKEVVNWKQKIRGKLTLIEVLGYSRGGAQVEEVVGTSQGDYAHTSGTGRKAVVAI